MEQGAQSENEKKALNLLKDSSLKESFVRGVREQWVRRELRRIEMASKSKTFLEMRAEVLDFFPRSGTF